MDELEKKYYRETDELIGGTFQTHIRDAIWQFIESGIESLLKKERIDEDRMWQEWITVRGSEPIPLKDIKQRISELEGG